MFDFTNKKPDPLTIWAEVNKSTPETAGLPVDLIKTVMWIMLCAGKDFKKSKEAINGFLRGEMKVDKFRNNFTLALQTKYNVHVSPITMNIPKDTMSCTAPKGLELPVMVFKSIFKNVSPEIFKLVAESVWDPDEYEMTEHISDLEFMKALTPNQKITPYLAQIDPDKILKNFKTYFILGETEEEITVISKSQLIMDMLTRLIETGEDTIAAKLPIYKYVGE